MVYEDDEDEIDLVELFKFIWDRKWKVLIPCFLAGILAVAFSIVSLILPPEKSPLPNQYTSVAKILVDDGSSSGGISLSGGLSSLASLAGVSTGAGSRASAMLLTFAETNTFKDEIIDKFGLIEKWEIEKHVKTASRKALSKILTIEQAKDEDTDIITVSFIDIDPAFAKEVVDYAVDLLVKTYRAFKLENNLIKKQNYESAMEASYQKIVEYTKEIQTLENSGFSTIVLDAQMKKLELEAEEQIYATIKASYEMLVIEINNLPQDLHIIQTAEESDMKSKPSRGIICAVIVCAVGFIGCLILFFKFMAKKNEEKDIYNDLSTPELIR